MLLQYRICICMDICFEFPSSRCQYDPSHMAIASYRYRETELNNLVICLTKLLEVNTVTYTDHIIQIFHAVHCTLGHPYRLFFWSLFLNLFILTNSNCDRTLCIAIHLFSCSISTPVLFLARIGRLVAPSLPRKIKICICCLKQP